MKIKNKTLEKRTSILSALIFGKLESNPLHANKYIGYNLHPETHNVEKEKNVCCISIHKSSSCFSICDKNPIKAVRRAWSI